MKTLFLLGTLLIAQASGEVPPPEGFLPFIQCIVYSMGAFLMGIWIWQALKKPKREPDIEVDLAGFAKHEHVAEIKVQLPQLATKAELTAVSDGLHEHVAEVHKQMDARRSQGIGNLHEKMGNLENSTNSQIGQVRERLASVETSLKSQEADLFEHGRKLDLILERLPRK